MEKIYRSDGAVEWKRYIGGVAVISQTYNSVGKNADGQIYRYLLGNGGTAHFSGINGVGDGVRNFTKYANDRLNGL